MKKLNHLESAILESNGYDAPIKLTVAPLRGAAVSWITKPVICCARENIAVVVNSAKNRILLIRDLRFRP